MDMPNIIMEESVLKRYITVSSESGLFEDDQRQRTIGRMGCRKTIAAVSMYLRFCVLFHL